MYGSPQVSPARKRVSAHHETAHHPTLATLLQSNRPPPPVVHAVQPSGDSRVTPLRTHPPPAGVLGVLKARSPTLAEFDKDADEVYRHRVGGTTQLLPVQQVPDWSTRLAEDRLVDADRRVRLLQAEAEQLDALRKQQLMAGEEEVLRLKRQLLDDWDAREREWEKRREEELRNIKLKEQMLEEHQQRLSELEDKLEQALRDEEERSRERARQIELENHRHLEETEVRLRRELRNVMEPELREELERELTHKITGEVKAELQREFANMCEAMRLEVQNARERLTAEIERELEPVVEERLLQELYPTVRRRVEEELNATVMVQLREASNATQLIRKELQAALEQRDRSLAEVQTLQEQAKGLQEQARAEVEAARREHEQAQADLRNARQDLQARDATISRLEQQLSHLDAEHRLLQQAATGVLNQAKQNQAARTIDNTRLSPSRPRNTLADHVRQAQEAHPPLSGSYGSSTARPEPAPSTPSIPWPPQLLPGGGVVC